MLMRTDGREMNRKGTEGTRLSRRGFLTACAAGAAGTLGATGGLSASASDRRDTGGQAASGTGRRRRGSPRAGRVVILGFDGLDHGLMTRWLREGHLPNLARLAAEGTFAPLATTSPAESPVAWAAFSICANPGKTGIFDFLTKPEGSYYPTIGLAHEERVPFHPETWLRAGLPAAAGLLVGAAAFGAQKAFRVRSRRALLAAVPAGALVAAGGLTAGLALVPRELPTPVCDRLGTGFWTVAGQAGVPSVILQAPVCFPAEEVPNGRLLSGLGVPDIRKTWGTSTLYDSRATGETDTEMGGKLVGVTLENGVANTTVLGPPNFMRSDERPVALSLRLEADRKARRVTIRVGGRSQTVGERRWSDFFEMPFRLNPLVKVVGLGRFYVVECGQRLRVYLSQISIHPEHVPPHVNLSQPHGFAADLARRIGPYKTLGWAIDTWALNAGFLDEEAFLEDLYAVMGQREAMLQSELKRTDWQLLFMLFQATDRVQHMFWRLLDQRHPMYDAGLAERYGNAILKTYQEADAIVGRVRSQLGPDDVLMVISDHGFASFAKAVNVNTLLARKGLLALKDTRDVRDRRLEDLFGQGEFWPNVDWSKTEAFALGLSQVYLNTTWREPSGIVHPGRDYRRTRDRVAAALTDLTDPETGRRVVHSVIVPEEAYHGEGMDRAADLVVCLNRGYRISWQTALGGIPPKVIEPNLARWSGDHCSVAAPLVPGVLFANRRLPVFDAEAQSRRAPGAHLIDIGVTALDLLGVPADDEMDGRSLLARQPAPTTTRSRGVAT